MVAEKWEPCIDHVYKTTVCPHIFGTLRDILLKMLIFIVDQELNEIRRDKEALERELKDMKVI